MGLEPEWLGFLIVDDISMKYQGVSTSPPKNPSMHTGSGGNKLKEREIHDDWNHG